MKVKVQPTAAQRAYAVNQQDIETLIVMLRNHMEWHAADAAKEPSNYGYSGELCYAREKLKELVVFFMNAHSEDSAMRAVEQHLAANRK